MNVDVPLVTRHLEVKAILGVKRNTAVSCFDNNDRSP